MRFSGERVAIAAGYSLMLTGLSTVGGVFIVEQPGPVYQKIKAREDELALSIGRPLAQDINIARTALLPQRPNSEIPDYYGDPEACDKEKRSRMEMIDSACKVLARAGERLAEWVNVQAEDGVITSLREEHNNKVARLGLMLSAGMGQALAGIGLGIYAIHLRGRRTDEIGQPAS